LVERGRISEHTMILPLSDDNPERTTMTDGVSVEARLRRLEDLEEIRELLIEYQRRLDAKDLTGYASLFATNGEFVAGDTRAQGHDEIRALVEGMLGNLLTTEQGDDAHLVVNPSVHLDGDRATTHVTWVYVVRGPEDQPVLSKLGHYDDVLVREHGRWRFLRRLASSDMAARSEPNKSR
jgi:uncharacterized protein (TIGR02246 family)